MPDGNIVYCVTRLSANDPGSSNSICNTMQITNIEALKTGSATDRVLSDAIMKSVTPRTFLMERAQ